MPAGTVPRKLLGRTEAAFYTPPLRTLNRRTSLGYECADFADQVIGVPLLPWQRWAAIRAMELLPDGSFRFRKVLVIVARQNGKSHLKRAVSLWRMFMEPKTQILGVAQEVKLARKQWNFCQAAIHDAPQLEEEWGNVRNVNGDEYFWLQNGSEYAIGAASRKSGRGSSNDEVNIDELREQHSWAAWAALSKTINARPNPQIWCMSNAGDDRSVVLNQLQDAGHDGRDDSLCILEWSAPEGCELDDPRAWAQANPGLGHIISAAAIRSSLTDPPEIFRTEVLCQRVPNLDSAIDAAAWDNCADAAGTMDAHRGRIAAVLDVAPDGRHATLAVAAKLTDGRVRVEITAAWDGTDAVRAELPGLLAEIKPAAFGWYPSGPAARIATTLRPLAMRYNRRPGGKREPGDVPEDGALTGSWVTEACQELADLAKALRVVHPADPLLDSHVRSASKLNSGDGWRFTRKNEGHVDAAYAAAGGVKLALTIPPPRRSRIHSIVA